MQYESGIQKLIKKAKEQHPDLDQRGIGPHALPYIRNCHSLNTASGRMQVGTAVSFLEARPWNRRTTDADSLKAAAETWSRENHLAPYISQGALIVAAIYFEMDITSARPEVRN